MIYQNYFDDMDIGAAFLYQHGVHDYEPFAYRMHWHQYMEIICMIRGELFISAGRKEAILKEGDMAVIVPRELHSVNYTVSGPLEFYMMQFDPMVLFGALPDSEEFREVYPYLFLRDHRSIYSAEALAETPLPRLMRMIDEEAAAQRYGYKLSMRAYLLEICVWILRQWNMEIPLPTDQHLYKNEMVNAAFEYIQNHLSEPITTSGMALLVSASVPHFCRTFKKITGYSFINYLRYVRTMEAQKLLLTTDHAIAQIAAMVGYADVNYFIRSFKKSIGVPPLRYRLLEYEKTALLKEDFHQ